MKSTFGLALMAIAVITTTVDAGVPATMHSLRRELVGDRSCNFACLAVMRPVYDENGKMYSNKCVMEREKCREKKFAIDNKKSCENSDTGSKSEADEDSTDQSDTSCPQFCFDVYNEVTDENGKTYSNECYMKRAKCKDKKKSDDDAGDILKEYERIYGKPFGASRKSNVEDGSVNK